MTRRLLPARGLAAKRTTISALIMLIGVVALGTGYYRNDTTLLFIGVVVTLVGVMTELVAGIILSPRGKSR